LSLDLDDRAVRGAAGAQEDRHPHHSFVADDARFHRRAIHHRGHQRDQSLLRKIDVANLFASVVQNIAQTQMDGPEPDRQPFKVLFRQRRQKSISG
jgi:hypothetical protein